MDIDTDANATSEMLRSSLNSWYGCRSSFSFSIFFFAFSTRSFFPNLIEDHLQRFFDHGDTLGEHGNVAVGFFNFFN